MNEFRGYIAPILRWWWLVLISCVISGVASYFVAIRLPKVFQAGATLVVGSAGTNPNPSAIDFGVGSSLAQYYQRLAESSLVQNRVKSALGGIELLPDYTTSTADNLLEINVTDTSPELAQAVALALANEVINQSPSATSERESSGRAFSMESPKLRPWSISSIFSMSQVLCVWTPVSVLNWGEKLPLVTKLKISSQRSSK